jgi:hypothetical protein
MVIKNCIEIYSYPDDVKMDGLQDIPGALDLSSFNGGGGGGVRNEASIPSGPHPNVSLIYCIAPLPF